jgi:hypothetical protein
VLTLQITGSVPKGQGSDAAAQAASTKKCKTLPTRRGRQLRQKVSKRRNCGDFPDVYRFAKYGMADHANTSLGCRGATR